MAGISDLPVIHDIDAGYTPQYAKIARILRDKTESSGYQRDELTGWQSSSTSRAAEGHRGDRQPRFTTGEVRQLAAILSGTPSQLTTRCANCGGRPPTGSACPACGATPSDNRPAATVAADAPAHPLGHDHAKADG